MSPSVSRVVYTANRGLESTAEWLGAAAMTVIVGLVLAALYFWMAWYLRRDAEKEYARLLAASAEFARRWPDHQLSQLPFAELAGEVERYWLLSLLVTDSGMAKRVRSMPPMNIVDIQRRLSILTSALRTAGGR